MASQTILIDGCCGNNKIKPAESKPKRSIFRFLKCTFTTRKNYAAPTGRLYR